MRERLDLKNAIFGAVAWVVLWVVPWPTDGLIARVERLVLLVPFVLFPLALAIVLPGRAGPYRWCARMHWGATLSLMFGAARPWGAWAALLVAPWLVLTVALAVFRLEHRLRGGMRPLEELCIDAATLYLPVGAVWLLCAWGHFPLLGYDAAVVLFTAAHFHFAGFAAPIIVGVFGRRLVNLGSRTRGIYRASAMAVMLGPPLVAIGIMGSHAVETAAAFTLAAGLSLFGITSVVRLAPSLTGLSRVLVIITGGAPCLSMALACLYVLGLWRDHPYIDIATMVQLHGRTNALGFSLFGVLAAARLDRA